MPFTGGPFAPMGFPPMPRTRTLNEEVNDLLDMDVPPAAFIAVDGEIIETFEDLDRAKQAYKDMPTTAAAFGHPDWQEIALSVYKSRYRVYFREKLRSR